MKHLCRWLAVFLVPVLFIICDTSPVRAADLRNEDTVIITGGDVINDNLYITANRIDIDGTVNGDVLAIGGSINVNGKVNGSITAIGWNINIGGEIAHTAHLAGVNINISGIIGSDLVVAGNLVIIGDDPDTAVTAKTTGDLIFAARNIDSNAAIGGNVHGYGDSISLDNEVSGNIEVSVDQLTIRSTADIQGDLTYTSNNQAIIQSGARIGGITSHRMPETKPNIAGLGWILAFLMTLVTGTAIIMIAPKRSLAVAAALERKPLQSLGWGALILFVTPVAVIIAFITILGIPAGLICLAVYLIAIYLSQITVGLFLGNYIVTYISKVQSRSVLVVAFALGFSILTLVSYIPYVGFPLWLATTMFGIGAMVLSRKTVRTTAPARISEITR